MALPTTALRTLKNVTDPMTWDSPNVGTSCFSCGASCHSQCRNSHMQAFSSGSTAC